MEEKFKETLRALLHGTKNYKLGWNYLSDAYYNDIEAYYTQTNETEDGDVYVTFDSAFEAVHDDLLLFIACADVTDEDGDAIGELFELRIYAYDEPGDIDVESAILVYDSMDEPYEAELKDLYAFAAGSASGVDQVMDKLIRELGEQK